MTPASSAYERERADRERLEHRAVGDGLDDGHGREGERCAAVLERREQATGERHQRERTGLDAGALRAPERRDERADVREHREDDQQRERARRGAG